MQFSGFKWENYFEGSRLLVLHTKCHCSKKNISVMDVVVFSSLDESKHTHIESNSSCLVLLHW